MRRHSLAAVAAATADRGGAAGGYEIAADQAVREHLVDCTNWVDNGREMAQLATDEFWATFSVMHGELVEATTKRRDRADEAN